MNRRDLLTSAFALAALTPLAALAYKGMPYAPGVLEDALKRGDTVLLDFYAPWCTTCRAQTRVIDALIAETPAYGEKITFITVDWDSYKRAPITKRYRVPRRSTLIALKGKTEIGRIVAGTSKAEIKALLDAALAAAIA